MANPALRWTLAVLAAVLAYVVSGFAAIIAAAYIAKSALGYSVAIAIATSIGVSSGTRIAPRHRWRLAVCVFGLLAALFPTYAIARGIISSEVDAGNLLELAGTAFGVAMAYRLAQRRFGEQGAH